mgnify:CR=1 FL=1
MAAPESDCRAQAVPALPEKFPVPPGINAVIVVLPVVIADPEIEGEIADHFLEIYNGFQRGQFEKIVKGNAVISDQKDVVLYDCSRIELLDEIIEPGSKVYFGQTYKPHLRHAGIYLRSQPVRQYLPVVQV